MLERLNYPAQTEKAIASFIGEGMRNLVEQCIGTREPAKVTRAVAVFRTHYWKNCTRFTRVYPGVRPLLRALRERPMAVVTNKPSLPSHRILRHQKIQCFFQVVCGGETVEPRKPHPAPLLYSLKKLKVPPQNALFIGDSEVDARAGRAAGVVTIGILNGIGSRHHLKRAKPDYQVHHIREILPLLKRKGLL